ncbi:MAG: hypothetical protein ACYSTS_18245 [Planctomycetota bacterium]|jgi:uncharacterized protein YydD (DUF2326 family)
MDLRSKIDELYNNIQRINDVRTKQAMATIYDALSAIYNEIEELKGKDKNIL